jgi:hypothetical protein
MASRSHAAGLGCSKKTGLVLLVGIFTLSRLKELAIASTSFIEKPLTTAGFKPDFAGSVKPDSLQTNATNIYLQNQRIGTVSSLCPNGICDIVKPEKNISWKCPNINGPVVMRQGSVFNLFASSHIGASLRHFKATSLEGPWQEAGTEIPSFAKCAGGLHSPDVLLFNGTYYMFAHGHECRDAVHKQPTIVLTSKDLDHWEFPTKEYAAKEYFYAKVFAHNNAFYAIAKSQEDGVGSMVLLRSESPLAPFKYVRRFAKGVRHVSIHRKGDILFVFFSLIGDLPERILLGTIDLDEEEWRLLPGPVVLVPPPKKANCTQVNLALLPALLFNSFATHFFPQLVTNKRRS